MALVARWDFDGNTDKSGNGHDIDADIPENSSFVGDNTLYYDIPSITSLGKQFSFVFDFYQEQPTSSSAREGSMWVALNSSSGGNLFRLGIFDQGLFLSVGSGDDKRWNFDTDLTKRCRVLVTVDYKDLNMYIEYGRSYNFTSAAEMSAETGRALSLGQEWDTNSRSDMFDGEMFVVEYYDHVLTLDEFERELSFLPSPMLNAYYSNKETREMANIYSDLVEVKSKNLNSKLSFRQGKYLSIFENNGEQRKMGYFESKVLIQDVPAPNRKVMCFTQHGQLLDETYSAEDGTYRFDHLLLDTKYLFVAHDNQDTPNTPPEYQAVAAGFQTATPYVED
ncbi:hypothetical protein [Psychromonas sp.]|uniref:hypothetical protein n=1 Tax=Psychromonas sp. TaxID=1884585 RepID=UPI003A9877AE